MKSLLEKRAKYYYVSSKVFVCDGKDAKPTKTLLRKKFGNYFRSKIKAEEARKKMASLFYRLKIKK